jgi:tetratricopeptide (TPR) repeat protein
VAESDRRSGGSGGGGRGGRPRPDGRSGQGGSSSGRSGDARGGKGREGGGYRSDDRRGGRSEGARYRGDDRRGPRRDDRRPDRRDDRPAQPPANPAPALDEDIDWSQLDPEARKELRSIPKEMAELVGKHLVAAGRLLDTDPEAALEHARYVKTKASRIPIVREAVGIAAYHAGQWSEALSELRAVRRMTHTDQHVAIMADVERALGRPERAIELSREVDSRKLPPDVAVELRIVAAGARRDLGQLEAAVVSLQGADLDPKNPQPWSARLFYAYADNLLAAGRKEEAATWFVNAAEADVDDETDAAERAAELATEE